MKVWIKSLTWWNTTWWCLQVVFFTVLMDFFIPFMRVYKWNQMDPLGLRTVSPAPFWHKHNYTSTLMYRFSSFALCCSSKRRVWTMMDSWPPTVRVARLRGADLLLVDVPPEPRSSSAPKRPLEVIANVVFSRSVLGGQIKSDQYNKLL